MTFTKRQPNKTHSNRMRDEQNEAATAKNKKRKGKKCG